jgi:hypothetical protein
MAEALPRPLPAVADDLGDPVQGEQLRRPATRIQAETVKP